MNTTNDLIDPMFGRIEQTAEDTFEAPENIIKSISACRTVYEKLRANHLKRIQLYKEIDGLLLGNPPYKQSDLNAAGLEHVSNFNDMSANAIFERYCQSYWNLLHNSEYAVNFILNMPGVPEAQQWAKTMARHWTWAVKNKWKSFITNLASLSSQLVKFGVSPTLFPDERSPKWRVVEAAKFYIPDQTQSDLDLLGTVFIETEFSVQYLWQIYEHFKNKVKTEGPNPEDTRKLYTPWNPYEVGCLLMRLNTGVNSSTDQYPIDLYDLEQKVLANDTFLDNIFGDTIKLISCFQKEYDGSISHYIMHRYWDQGEFLYFKPSQYKSLDEALILFTMNPGAYTVHTNRGVGHKIFSLAQAKIMMDCTVVDAAKWASTPIIKSPALTTKDTDQIKFFPGVAINIGSAEYVPNNLGANLQSITGTAQYISSLMQFNLTYSGSDPATPDPDKGSLSPTQTQLMAIREFSILKNYIMHYYSTLDHLIQNMTAKMLKSKSGYPDYDIAETWKRRCIKDGVPEIVFDVTDDEDSFGIPEHIEVYASRTAGAGSQVGMLIALQSLQAIAGSFGPREERAYKAMYISATIGPEYVDTFMQEGDDVDEISGGASLAGTENAIMQDGKSPVFSPDNEHRAHMAIHMTLASFVIQQIQQQQMDVIQADSIFSVLVPHMGDHLEALARNPFTQTAFEKFRQMYADISRYAALNKKNAAAKMQAEIRRQQELEAQNQRVMTEEELKTMQTMNAEQRKNIDMENKIQRQNRAAENREKALDRKTDADIAREDRETQAKINAEAVKVSTQASKNTSVADAMNNPREALSQLNGNTIAPYDIEGT